MKPIIFSITNQLAVITLNRPKSLNSLNTDMLGDLNRAVREVADSDARALLINAKGRGFCSGQDLSDPGIDARADGDLGRMLEQHYNPLMRALLALDIPVVSAVGGVAAGAGVSLALAADLMLMHKSASLVLAFSRIGLVPDAGSSWLLSRAIGLRRATALALTGATISSAQALEWGLAWAVYDEDFDDQTEKICARLAAAPTQGLGYTKRVFGGAAVNDFGGQLEVEKEFQRLAGNSADYREGVDAFLAGRKPQFTGQ